MANNQLLKPTCSSNSENRESEDCPRTGAFRGNVI